MPKPNLKSDVEALLPDLPVASPEYVDEIVAGSASKFKGGWATDELVYSQDFSSGIPSTNGWSTAGGSGGSSYVTQQAVSSSTGEPKPGYLSAARLRLDDSSTNLTLILDLNGLSALSGRTPSRVKFYWDQDAGGGCTFRYKDGASVLLERAATAGSSGWHQAVFPIASINSDLVWQHQSGGGYSTTHAFVTGIQIYAAAGDGYEIGDIVTWQGSQWTSTADANTTEPGVSGSWEIVGQSENVLVHPRYSTAGRPQASASNLGCSIYDTDLHLPLWSNGTAWTNAAGQTV